MSWLPSSSEQTSYQYSHRNAANHMRGGMCRHVLLGFFKELGDRVDKLATSPMLLLWGRVLERNGLRVRLFTRRVRFDMRHRALSLRSRYLLVQRLQLARYDGIRGHNILHSGQIFSWVVEYYRTSRTRSW